MRGSDFAELTAFVLVAEHKSYAKAAKLLGIAVSTLSHRVRQLEEQKGVRLLNRTTRSVAPTKSGERLLARLRPVLTALERASRIDDHESDMPAGPLRITIPPPAVRTIVTPILARFMAAYPRVELEISVDGASVDIVREGFDAGIRYGPHLERDMIALRIGEPVRPVTVASPAYVTRCGQPKSPEELSVHECIHIRLPGGNILPWRYQRRGKAFTVQPGGSLVVNDRELELAAALDGGGIAYLLSNRVASALDEGRLTALLEDWALPKSNFHLYYPSRRQLPLSMQAFIGFLRAEGLVKQSIRSAHGSAA